MYVYGVRPSKDDPRDYLVRNVMATPTAFPESFECSPLIPIHDQDIFGMCVAFFATATKEWEEWKERGTFQHLSAAFIYGNRKPGNYEGEGMEPRDALENLRTDGVCPLDMYPIYGTYQTCKQGITQAMRDAALPNVIKSYARATTADELKTALMTSGPCGIAFPVYESFEKVGSDGVVPLPSGGVVGYHMVMVVGWRADGRWIIQNSWGVNWGDYGRCYMPRDYLTMDPNAPEDKRMEVWTVVDLVSAPPAPSNGKTVAVDPGHGGRNQNIGLNGYRESDYALKVGLMVRDTLKAKGYNVVMTRTVDRDLCTPDPWNEALDLARRCRVANDAHADIYVSLHTNSGDPSAHGTETFCYSMTSKGAALAQAIQKALVGALGTTDRGAKAHPAFYVLENTTMPAALTEVGFHTSTTDIVTLNDSNKQVAAAQAIANAIDLYFNQTTDNDAEVKQLREENETLKGEVANLQGQVTDLTGRVHKVQDIVKGV